MKYLRGDTGFVCSTSDLAEVIDYFQSFGTKVAKISHTLLVVDDGDENTAVIVEALERVTQWTLGKAYPPSTTEMLSFYRPLGVPDPLMAAAIAEVKSMVGEHYGWWKLGLCAIDGLLSKLFRRDVVWARRLAWNGRYPICSRVVIAFWQRIQHAFGLDKRAAEPQEEYDVARNHPSAFICVHDFRRIHETGYD